MITCKICQQQFKSIISHTHLKKHGITPHEYKIKFGVDSLSSGDYKTNKSKHFSNINSGREAWNKNLSIQQSEKYYESIKKREEKYNSGEMKRREYNSLNENTKSKISLAIKAYAENNPDEIKQRWLKAKQTKELLGVPVVPSFLGYKHSISNKKLFAEILKKHTLEKMEKSHDNILQKIKSINLNLLNDIHETDLLLKCNTCSHEFSFTKQYFHDCKFHDKLCPSCNPRNIQSSRAQNEIFEYVKLIFHDAISNFTTEHGHFDIFIPSLQIGIEYNGLYWHSEQVLTYNNKSKIKDYEKYINLRDKYRIICIFEDEWLNKKEIVLSRLNHIFGISNNKIYARNCVIKQIDAKIANEFYELNHIQGTCRANVHLGAFDKTNSLVSCMSFSKNNLSRKLKSQWEIARFCSLLNLSVVGIADKLFKHFISNNEVDSVISYADSRWSNGNLYKSIGFNLLRETVPNFWFFKPNELLRIHRFTLRKRDDEPSDITTKELRFQQGYYTIYDYGSSKWEWQKSRD